MLITVSSFIVVLIIVIIFCKKEGCVEWSPIIGGTFMGGILLTLLVYIVTWPFSLEHTYQRVEKNIVASKADARIEGEMHGCFYVRGKIEEKDYYFVLTKSGDVYKQDKAPVESTVIVETNGVPKIVKNKHFVGCGWSQNIRWHDKEPEYVNEQDTIYVPVGTVSNEMNFMIF